MEPRDQRINVRVTKQDMERIRRAAEADMRSPADFCRVAALAYAETVVKQMEREDG